MCQPRMTEDETCFMGLGRMGLEEGALWGGWGWRRDSTWMLGVELGASWCLTDEEFSPVFSLGLIGDFLNR